MRANFNGKIMPLLVRMTYRYPEPKFERPHNAPTRPARAYEVNCWWEDVKDFKGELPADGDSVQTRVFKSPYEQNQ